MRPLIVALLLTLTACGPVQPDPSLFGTNRYCISASPIASSVGQCVPGGCASSEVCAPAAAAWCYSDDNGGGTMRAGSCWVSRSQCDDAASREASAFGSVPSACALITFR